MSFWNYILKSKPLKIQTILLFLTILLFSYFLVCSICKSMGFTEMWGTWMEAFISFATIIVAFIGYNEKRQDWENSLPKKLNAVFDYNGESVFVIENAPLSGSDDIRQWGQQIGMQMNGDKLDFSGFKVEGPELQKDINGEYLMQYQLTVWLEKIKEKTNKTVWKYGDNGKVVEKKLLTQTE